MMGFVSEHSSASGGCGGGSGTGASVGGYGDSSQEPMLLRNASMDSPAVSFSCDILSCSTCCTCCSDSGDDHRSSDDDGNNYASANANGDGDGNSGDHIEEKGAYTSCIIFQFPEEGDQDYEEHIRRICQVAIGCGSLKSLTPEREQ